MTSDILIEDLIGASGISGDARGNKLIQNQFIQISLLNLLKKNYLRLTFNVLFCEVGWHVVELDSPRVEDITIT